MMRAQRTSTKHVASALKAQLCIGLLTSLAIQVGQIEAAAYNVTAKVNGQSQQIGSITANLNNRVEEGTFQLGGNYLNLMDDDNGCEFRWFQIVTEDPDPINYLGNENTSPYTDPPKNGWDYQRTPANDWQNGTAGADGTPFYENDDGGGPYAFPRYSDNFGSFGGNNNVPVHDDATGVLRTQDVPGYGSAALTDTELLFETYLVWMNADMRADKKFAVLWGYSWGVGRNGSGDYYDIGPSEITATTIVNGNLGVIPNALGADGFGDWTAVHSADIICVPEPGALLMFVFSFTVLRYRRIRS